MFEELRKKYKKKCIGVGVFFLLLGVGVIALSSGNIKVFVKKYLVKPVALESLDASDLKDGLKVTAKIEYAIDYYKYTETTKGQKTSMSFIIPVGEKEWMGLECSGSNMRQLEANMELYWTHLSEEDVSLDDVLSEMKPVKISGTVVKMSTTTQWYYNTYIDSLGWTEEQTSIFLPYVIKLGDVEKIDTSELVAAGLIFLVLAGFGIGYLIAAARCNNLKEVTKYCSEKSNPEYEMQKIEQFYQMGEPVEGMRANNEYFMAVNGTNVSFAPAEKLIWAYFRVVQHRTNFIPTGKTYSVLVKRSDGVQHEVAMKDEAACKRALGYLASNYPYMYIGYDNKWNQMYNKNRAEMIRLVGERKAEMIRRQQDTGLDNEIK